MIIQWSIEIEVDHMVSSARIQHWKLIHLIYSSLRCLSLYFDPISNYRFIRRSRPLTLSFSHAYSHWLVKRHLSFALYLHMKMFSFYHRTARAKSRRMNFPALECESAPMLKYNVPFCYFLYSIVLFFRSSNLSAVSKIVGTANRQNRRKTHSKSQSKVYAFNTMRKIVSSVCVCASTQLRAYELNT